MRAAFVALVLFSGTAGAQESKPALLTVTGVGTVLAKPDRARVTLGVETRGPDVALAAKQNALRLDAVIGALRRLGVEAKDIQTIGFGVGATDYNAKTRQVSNALEVTIRKLTDAGKIVDAALKAGANTASELAYELINPEPLHDQALQQAVRDAQRKARALAQAAGGGSLSLESLTEDYSGGNRISEYASSMNFYSSRANMNTNGLNTPITSNRTTVSAMVTLQYRLTFSAGKE